MSGQTCKKCTCELRESPFETYEKMMNYLLEAMAERDRQAEASELPWWQEVQAGSEVQ